MADPLTNDAAVLLAEDDEHDVFFMRRAFEQAEVHNPLISVSDGQEAIWYLNGEGAYAERTKYPEPRLLLLDLKMPLVDGFEVLGWIRQHPRWRDRLTVVVITSSGQEADRQRALELGAREYLVKPSDSSTLIQMVRELKGRWLEPAA